MMPFLTWLPGTAPGARSWALTGAAARIEESARQQDAQLRHLVTAVERLKKSIG